MTTFPLSARLARSVETFAKSMRQRRIYAELAKMDDHLLKDIGITRVDVDAMRRMW